MKMFEDYLIKTCFKVADRFQDRSLREEYQGVAESCRLPYWDWTKSRLPNIITASRVQVIDEDGSNIEVRNPFAGYQYVVSAERSFYWMAYVRLAAAAAAQSDGAVGCRVAGGLAIAPHGTLSMHNAQTHTPNLERCVLDYYLQKLLPKDCKPLPAARPTLAQHNSSPHITFTDLM